VDQHSLDVRRLGPELVPYEIAWEQQRGLHAARAEGLVGDTVLLLEHPPVFTAGKRTEAHERPLDGTPVIDVDRGGKITFHGPGQLVGYPILALPEHVYVVDYVRRLEEALIRTCADLGLPPGGSGVDRGCGCPPTAGARSASSPRSASGCRAR
jgi:lipoyl(octanoyl) transferase